MNARELAFHLRQAIVSAQDQGNTAVEAESLVRYLDNVIQSEVEDPSPGEMERYNSQLQLSAEHYRAGVENNLEMFRSVIQSGQSALRTAFLLNGGASIALLAVIGNMVSEPGRKLVSVSGLADSLIVFVIGAFAIAFTSGVTYVSQWFSAGEKDWHKRTGFVLNVFAILIGFSSFGFFLWGMVRAYNVFQLG